MKSLIIVVAMTFGLAGAGVAAAQDAATIAKGQKVYASNKCSQCHSVEGKGNKKGPLDEVGSKLSTDEIRAWLLHPDDMAAKAKSTRKPVMKPYDKLPKDDLEALVAYLANLKKK
jgi:mono/diheme cytochrome c family protein